MKINFTKLIEGNHYVGVVNVRYTTELNWWWQRYQTDMSAWFWGSHRWYITDGHEMGQSVFTSLVMASKVD